MGSKGSVSPDFCEWPACYWPFQIQRHRIHPGKDGGKYKLGNVISLCPSHHWMADHGFIDQQQLFEIVERRMQQNDMEPTEIDGNDTRSDEGAD